ncbi:GWxTD domain-containing protein [candidate division KSB1 bacterium]|nr:GWxTD domain-containing protein [candidate division KSB1 bacterium]
MKIRNSIICIVLAFTFFPHSAFSQGRLKFALDIAKFRAKNGLTYLEINTSIPRNILKYELVEDRLESNFEIEVKVFMGETEIFNETYLKTAIAGNLAEIDDTEKILNRVKLYMKKGEYDLKVKVTDLGAQTTSELVIPVSVDPSDFEGFALSDIALATSIQKSTTENEFYNNGYMVVPNPEGIFGNELQLLYFYTEIYNLKFESPSDAATYNVSYFITSGTGEIVKTYPPKTRKKPGDSSIEAGRISVRGFQSGRYNLHLKIVDNESGDTVEKQKEFYILTNNAAANVTGVTTGATLQERIAMEESQLANMDEDALKEFFEQMVYVTNNDDKNAFKSFALPEKKRMLAVFWAERDPQPETLVNEFKQEYFAKITYTNNQFREFRPGWKTDRGKIHINYGKPDFVEYFSNTAGMKPHQIWYYYDSTIETTDRVLQFIFADMRQANVYDLIHSTAVREMHNEDWRELIIK